MCPRLHSLAAATQQEKTIALILEGKGKAAEISVEKISGLGRKTTQLTPVRTQMLSAGSSS